MTYALRDILLACGQTPPVFNGVLSYFVECFVVLEIKTAINCPILSRVLFE